MLMLPITVFYSGVYGHKQKYKRDQFTFRFRLNSYYKKKIKFTIFRHLLDSEVYRTYNVRFEFY